SLTDYKDYFHQLKINVPATLLISENDPWLDFFEYSCIARTVEITCCNFLTSR
ncbi:esterase, partial [Acinetobacter baumannii]